MTCHRFRVMPSLARCALTLWVTSQITADSFPTWNLGSSCSSRLGHSPARDSRDWLHGSQFKTSPSRGQLPSKHVSPLGWMRCSPLSFFICLFFSSIIRVKSPRGREPSLLSISYVSTRSYTGLST